MLQTHVLGVPQDQKIAAAVQIAAIVGDTNNEDSRATAILKTFPDSDRDEVARLAISAGASTSSVSRSLQSIREDELPSAPSRTPLIIAGVLGLIGLVGIVWYVRR